MLKYALARVVQALPTLLLLSIVSFVLIHVVPGGPAVVMLGNKATPALIAQINRSLGLNKPLWIQYVIWLGQLLRGHLGYAYTYHQSVTSLILVNLPRTLILVVTAIAISHVVAIIIGIYQAVHRDRPVDHVLSALLYFLYAMPTFWLGVLMVSTFSINLGWFPSGGLYNPLLSHPTVGSYVDHLILPASVLIIGSVAGWG
ncbi:MAG: ABC transporter permease, partial [Firmicutes bacterium]|nr:ABC transporter permease [Bacillota bacterium]